MMQDDKQIQIHTCKDLFIIYGAHVKYLNHHQSEDSRAR